MNNRRWFLSIFIILFVFGLAVSACNMPGRRTPTPSGFEMINTAAARTVAAQLTEISRPPVATAGPTFTVPQPTALSSGPLPSTPSPSPAPAVTLASGGPQPTPAPQADACNRSRFVKDVTIPDNTVIQPGETFTKTWRLKNIGKCTWDEGYAMVFTGGERLGATGRVALPEVVGPDETVDLSVEMTAPAADGTYRSEWKLSNAAGESFGGGKNGDQPVWAMIKVSAPGGGAGRQYDFVSSASSAAWYSAAGDSAGLPLAFNGSPQDPNGAAILADGIPLETGQTSGKVLLMVPKQVVDGYVYGIFPQYRVQAGDRLKARVGLAANQNGSCRGDRPTGNGKVIFQVAARQGEDVKTLLEVAATCDRVLTPIDLDLSTLRGQDAEIILVVRASGDTQGNWAVWNSPQIINQ